MAFLKDGRETPTLTFLDLCSFSTILPEVILNHNTQAVAKYLFFIHFVSKSIIKRRSRVYICHNNIDSKGVQFLINIQVYD